MPRGDGRRRPPRAPLAILVGAAVLLAVAPIVSAAGDSATDDAAVLAPAAPGPPIAPIANPDGMTTVIVTMRDQVDLTAIPGAGGPARQEGVIRALRATAAASQRDLLAWLARQAGTGRVARAASFWIFNGLSVTATPDVILQVAARADVAAVTADEVGVLPAARPTAKPTPTPTPAPTPTPTPAPTPTPTPAPTAPAGTPEANVGLVRAPALWALGYTGQGTVVASLDSGVDAGHPDLADRWRGGSNSWFDPYGQHPLTPVDLTGHGTATMGVIVGGDAGGTVIGVAPGARWIAARIFSDNGTATATAIHSAFQWVLDPDDDPATADAPQVVNGSWSSGAPGCSLEFQLDLQALRAVGIVPVFAAGNFGPGASTSVSPANNPEAVAVGSTDDADVLDPGSSRGPSACGEAAGAYPELVAPGVDVRTADRFGTYQLATGTSIAAPHVAGALALLLSAHPGIGAAAQEQALLASARDLGLAGADNDYGFGRLDVLAAHQWLNANPPPTLSPTPTPAPTATVDALAVPALSSGYGYWYTLTTSAAGPLAATWTLPKAVQATLAVYAGNPFAGRADPVRLSPPAGALAARAAKASSFAITTSAQPAGVYTVYFYVGANVGSSSGTVTAVR